MTNEQLLDESEPSGQRKRPVFLTVLCVLTWVGSAVLLFISWIQYSNAVELKHMMTQVAPLQNAGNDPELTRFLDNRILHALAQVTASICSIAGVIVLWRRRKWGFYIYTFGQLLSVAAVVWLTAESIIELANGIGLLLIGLVLLVPIGFIVLYAFNLKYLRK